MSPSFFNRLRKKIPLLLLLSAAIVAFSIGYKQLIGFKSTSDLSATKYYADKGSCPGTGISRAKLKTKLIGDKVFYILSLKASKNKKEQLPRSFTVKLSDKDGFDVQSFTMNSSNFTVELDASENFIGYSYQSADYMDADKYSSVALWTLTWTLD